MSSVPENWPLQRQKMSSRPCKPCNSRASSAWPRCRVLPARWSVRQLPGEATGERRIIALSWSFLLREWYRHSHWCLQRVMRPKHGVWFTSCNACRNTSENSELIPGLWSHSLLQQIQLQAAARRDIPTFSPYPWATTRIHLIIKWARSGTNSAENWSNQKISDKFSASLVSWSAMNASAEAQVFSFPPQLTHYVGLKWSKLHP